MHLLNLKPVSFKNADVRAFMERVRFVLTNIRADEMPDRKFMYDWLFTMFKDYSPIKNKVERIRESRDGSRFRTWDFLWHAINSHLMNVYEDENLADITKSLASGSVPGAPAFKGKRKKSKSPKKLGGAAGLVQGAPFNKKPGGGAPPKGPKAVPKDATAIALSKKHEERSLQEAYCLQI